MAYDVRLGRYSFDTGLSIRAMQTNRSETRFRLMTFKEKYKSQVFWTHVTFSKFESSRCTVEHHNKANHRLTWGYDPEIRHVGRNDVLFFSPPSAIRCPKSDVNPNLRLVWTRKLHDSDRTFFLTISGYGRFYFRGLITSIYRGKVELFLLLNPYIYTQFIEQLGEAGGVV